MVDKRHLFPNVYVAMDPDGYHVHLEKKCWHGHILKRHREQMKHRLYDIKSTIEVPDYIDERVENGVHNRVYFKHWKDRDRLGQAYLKVPTEVVFDKTSRVLTAHAVPLIHKRQK